MPKLVRITTIPKSLQTLLKGQLHFMGKNGFEVIGVSSDEKELYELEKDEKVKVFPVNMSRKITPIDDLSAIFKLYKILKKEKPNIVHTHTPKAGLVGMAASYLARVPHRLHTVAGLPLMESSGNKRKLLNFVEKFTYKLSTKVYPNSQGLYDFILESKFTSKNKLKVLANGSSNGININHFSKHAIQDFDLDKLKQNLNINENDFVFIFAGRLVSDKGINELIAAFKDLKLPNVKLILLGAMEEDLDPLNKETIEEIKTNENIISAGFQKDVRPYFAIADALVFPSYREGFPNVVMQAGAMELPSIVSNINGCNEIIVEGKNGTIIPVKNKEAILNAMIDFTSNKDNVNLLKKNARKMIQERYEQSVVWNALLDEYTNILETR